MVKTKKGAEKMQVPGGNDLLRKHIKDTINDFDLDFHLLEENNIQGLADIINENPLVCFFLPED